ncbi:hypothetical protein BPAE_0129g00220 [Botrytis paeoniae]|uniref:Uncharacterized protein n=1 Tax=Botrytis paeoniae TaxID=278948 RepID=A0A4Z1FJI2_9HELO|nr:hypothetical protein BPAE_0129g00220 [Botrytis paeoniae]
MFLAVLQQTSTTSRPSKYSMRYFSCRKAREVNSSHPVQNDDIFVLSNADAAPMAPNSWSQRAFMQTFTIAVIDSPVACVGVDLSSKECLPLPKLVSDISGTVYHDQHQQMRSLYQGRLRDGNVGLTKFRTDRQLLTDL